ncbi:MAG: tetratricopeptide repeat protein [Anaerolineae bacterium]|nr:tetratricopeptide repeat protein [Anaerolineae bacterium]
MLRQMVNWFGPNNTRVLAVLLAGAVFGSLGLQVLFAGESWLFAAQIALVWLFFVGLALTLSSRLTGAGKKRLWIALGPGLVLLGFGIVVPDYALTFGGAAMGWMVAAQFVLRGRVRMEYQAAIKHLRAGNIKDAISIMDKLIATEPNETEHYRFRAELFRLSSNLPKAITDYERITQIAPESPTGYGGLAEVYAQRSEYERAREYAQTALDKQPGQWMPLYNLGMIEDRLKDSDAVREHLEAALKMGLPHSRYRLLAHLWLARAAYRRGDMAATEQHLAALRQQANSLDEWQTIFASKQAAPLRRLLEADVKLAKRLLEPDAQLELLDR